MHTDPDLLSLHALGEDVLSAADRAHLAGCDTCRADAVSLRQVVTLARGVADNSAPTTTSSQAPVGPSPGVWSAIAAELELSPAARTALPSTDQVRRSSPPGRAAHTTRPSSRRNGIRRVRPVMLAAALAVVAAVVATSAVLLGPPDDERAQLAASLEPLLPAAGTGDAEVVGAGTAAASLQLTVDGLPATPGYHEVWLIDLDTGQMVSLGVLPSDGRTSYSVPPALDLTRYDVVDISDEPLNGDPTHSGVSLLRGTLA